MLPYTLCGESDFTKRAFELRVYASPAKRVREHRSFAADKAVYYTIAGLIGAIFSDRPRSAHAFSPPLVPSFGFRAHLLNLLLYSVHGAVKSAWVLECRQKSLNFTSNIFFFCSTTANFICFLWTILEAWINIKLVWNVFYRHIEYLKSNFPDTCLSKHALCPIGYLPIKKIFKNSRSDPYKWTEPFLPATWDSGERFSI